MIETTNYDSHCHLFTRKETLNLRLLFEIIFGLPIETEKHQEKQKVLDGKEKTFERILEKTTQIKRLINFLKTGCSDSEEDIFEIMEKAYANSFSIAPLMMDLECIFVSKRTNGSLDLSGQKDAIIEEFDRIVTEFQKSNDSFINEAIAAISGIKIADRLDYDYSILAELQKCNNELNKLLALFKDEKLDDKNLHVSLLSNFDLQKNDLTALQQKYPEAVFPFIAIDPRREGIVDKFINEIYAKNVFCGVKLYTPNGYSPTDPDLFDDGRLYAFCVENNIPITAHNSYTGLATPLSSVEIEGLIYDKGLKEVSGPVALSKVFSDGWVQERASKFNHPYIWEKVLQKYPKLKLNLAHFGRESSDWQTILYKMLSNPDYPNFYVDLACWCNVEDTKEGYIGIQTFYDTYFTNATDYIKNKILYGSDFYLDLMYVDSLKEYLDNFKKVFLEDEFKLISYTNARKFLFNK